MVKFSESTYEFNDGSGLAQFMLILSNPSSTAVTVKVDLTAVGEHSV